MYSKSIRDQVLKCFHSWSTSCRTLYLKYIVFCSSPNNSQNRRDNFSCPVLEFILHFTPLATTFTPVITACACALVADVCVNMWWTVFHYLRLQILHYINKICIIFLPLFFLFCKLKLFWSRIRPCIWHILDKCSNMPLPQCHAVICPNLKQPRWIRSFSHGHLLLWVVVVVVTMNTWQW